LKRLESVKTHQLIWPELTHEKNFKKHWHKVVTGVIYLRSNSQVTSDSLAQVTNENVIDNVDKVNGVQNVGTVEASTNHEEVSKQTISNAEHSVTENHEVASNVVTTTSSKVTTKRRKKTSASSTGTRNRSGVKKEVETLQSLEQKMKGVEWNLTRVLF
jgi:hypothetical protein